MNPEALDLFAIARAYLGRASQVDDFETRSLFVALAGGAVVKVEEQLAQCKLLLKAAEAELLRRNRLKEQTSLPTGGGKAP